MHLRKWLSLVLGITLLSIAFGVLTGGMALAEDPDSGQDPESGEAVLLVTPKTCDDNVPPKYYCTWIRYAAIANSTNWELLVYQYRLGRET